MKTRFIVYENFDHQSERKIAEFSDETNALKEFEWWKKCLEDSELSLVRVTEEKIG